MGMHRQTKFYVYLCWWDVTWWQKDHERDHMCKSRARRHVSQHKNTATAQWPLRGSTCVRYELHWHAYQRVLKLITQIRRRGCPCIICAVTAVNRSSLELMFLIFMIWQISLCRAFLQCLFPISPYMNNVMKGSAPPIWHHCFGQPCRYMQVYAGAKHYCNAVTVPKEHHVDRNTSREYHQIRTVIKESVYTATPFCYCHK